MPSGGRRPGAGKPKGYKHPQTLQRKADKEALRAKVLELVAPQLLEMVQAQIDHSKGVGYMILRRPDGTFTRATDVKQIDAALAIGGSAFKLFTQAPNSQAFMALWDRTLDKPIERQEVSGVDGAPLEIVIRKPWDK